MKNQNLSVLILAAGKGTRMKSSLPKVLHPVSGLPMVLRVLKSVFSLRPRSVALVVGHGGKDVIRTVREARASGVLSGSDKIPLSFVWQKNPRGSGHAVKMASAWVRAASRAGNRKNPSQVLVLCADTPLISPETLRSLAGRQEREGNAVTVATMTLENPFSYGRIVKDSLGKVRKIVEEKDATDPERGIREVNTGIYCFEAAKLLSALPKLRNDNAKKEFYLTDTLEHLRQMGYSIGSFQLNERPETAGSGAVCEAFGVNSRADLAAAETALRQKILRRLMTEGVTVVDPQAVYVSEEARIGADTVLWPGTVILGRTKIGSGCAIGPNSFIENSELGRRVSVRASFVHDSRISDDVKIGPFSHIRPGTRIAPGARVGNFSETKNARIGTGSKVSHLSYIGDTVMGDHVNVGAGTITCNYDGRKKHRTRIGSRAFIGSNVNLVAPVSVGKGALIGAGSTITRDVPAGSLGLERSRQIVKKGWTLRK